MTETTIEPRVVYVRGSGGGAFVGLLIAMLLIAIVIGAGIATGRIALEPVFQPAPAGVVISPVPAVPWSRPTISAPPAVPQPVVQPAPAVVQPTVVVVPRGLPAAARMPTVTALPTVAPPIPLDKGEYTFLDLGPSVVYRYCVQVIELGVEICDPNDSMKFDATQQFIARSIKLGTMTGTPIAAR